MRLDALAVGTRMPAWVNEGVRVYQKRLPRHLQLEFRELPAAQRSAGSTPDMLRQKEGDAMLRGLTDQTWVIALDEHGTSWTSGELAAQLQFWMGNYPHVAFLIGGADGLAEACKRRANTVWSLSALTLPHALVRVVLAEQIYRAWTLVQGHPYHRE
jgi:23S rRNA (pseudouridine1915-N3)-methyltransferase